MADHVYEVLDNCRDGMNHIHKADQAVVQCGCYAKLAKLEDLVLTSAAKTKLVDSAVLWCVIDSGDGVVVR